MIEGLGWLGVRTQHRDELVRFLREGMGLEPAREDADKDVIVFELPDGSRVELFGASDREHKHFDTGPVPGFLVDDIDEARDRLERAGAESSGRSRCGSQPVTVGALRRPPRQRLRDHPPPAAGSLIRSGHITRPLCSSVNALCEGYGADVESARGETAMDAIELIKNDHRTVERLFTQYEQATQPNEKREILNVIIQELSVHAAIEEEIFYPSLREVVAQGDELAEEGLHEHQEAKELLAELDGMEADDPMLDAKVLKLKKDIEHHVEEEESDMLPKIGQRLDPALLAEMGKEMAAARSHAPTRPHPHAPDEPPAMKVTGPAAAIIDRIRDKVQNRS